ncbi:MAG: peptide ABC transporter substrate-binding protein [Parcubacteria group bacterium]|jgi:peptide/nickel transport system substrate-binding protein
MKRLDWGKISQFLTNKERIYIGILCIAVAASLVATVIGFYLHFTKAVAVPGGEYSEAVVGQPMFVNPILAPGNDVDQDLCELIFSSLFKYDADGKLAPDLVESYEISDDKLTYTLKLKSGVKWHDGETFSSDDVLFTIQAIQDPAFKSPLRQSWQGVGVEAVDESTINFILTTPYVFFLNNLTVGILPRHIWEGVPPSNFILADYNLRPVGTGPYEFSDIAKDNEGNILNFQLIANDDYYDQKPYIKSFNLSFYFDEDSAIDAYNKKQVFGIGYISPSKLTDLKSRRSSNIHSINIPRYYAVFFNQQRSKVMADRDVRKALSLATDRKTIVDQVLKGEGKEIFSPIPPGTFGYTDDVKKFDFDIEKANKALDDAGWKRGDDGVRKKNDLVLEINLVTTDWPDLVATADILKNQWEAIGARVNLEELGVSDIQQNFIRPREYDALLFGQVLGIDPDPYAFWHSSQTRDPGLNLSLYSNPDVDKLLEKIRQETDEAQRLGDYKKFQQDITDDIPALFLYSPNYLYVTNGKVQGIGINSMVTPDKRYANVEQWYVKTKRVKK